MEVSGSWDDPREHVKITPNIAEGEFSGSHVRWMPLSPGGAAGGGSGAGRSACLGFGESAFASGQLEPTLEPAARDAQRRFLNVGEYLV